MFGCTCGIEEEGETLSKTADPSRERGGLNMNTVCAAPSRQPRDGTAEFQSLEPGGNVSESAISELLL